MGGRGGSGGSRSGLGGGAGAKRAKMPELSGSEKQVSWAKDIRNQAYDQLDALDSTIARIERDVSKRGGMSKSATTKEAESLAGFSRENVRTVRAELNDTFSQITSAKTIIEHRDNLSPNRISNLVQLEAKTGQVSAARKRRKS